MHNGAVVFYGKTHVRVIKLVVWGWPQVTHTSPKKATLSNRKIIFQKKTGAMLVRHFINIEV